MLENIRTKKGFFFVMTFLIILTYILTNLAMWSKTVSLQEERYSDNFKIANLDYASAQVSNETMTKFAKISAEYALYKLNNHTIEFTVKANDKEGKWVYSYINYSMRELIENGSADNSYFSNSMGMEYSETEKEDYTVNGFFKRINESFSKINLEVSKPIIENFNFNQTAIDKVSVSYNISFRVDDLSSGKASIIRKIPINFEFSIEGMNDPSISRNMLKSEYGNQHIEKQIFFHPNDMEIGGGADGFDISNNLKVEEKETGNGQGWFYGYLIDAKSRKSINPGLKMFYAIKGELSDIKVMDNYESYGAYIVTNNKDETTLTDIKNNLGPSKPIFISDGEVNGDNCDQGNGCIFFVSKKDISSDIEEVDNTVSIQYNIENFRDFLVCGYYFHNKNGPSYFQKLLPRSYERKGEEYGLSTFLVWDGIEGTNNENEDRSRLDIEFFGTDGETNTKIRGSPGCKFLEMCKINNYVGNFKLSMNTINEYLKEDNENSHFYCGDDGWSKCD